MPLHLAESANMVKLLLDNGAIISAKTIYGENVLSRAFIMDQFDVVKFLLEIVNNEIFTEALKYCCMPENFTRADFKNAMFGTDY